MHRSIFILTYTIGTIIILQSCLKKSTSDVNCQAEPDSKILVNFEPVIGGVDILSECYYKTLTKNEREIDISNQVKKGTFQTILSALIPILNFHQGDKEKTFAFTIYRIGELHNDAVIRLKDIAAVSRYYTNESKLFHELFVKNADGKFKKLTYLDAEIDEVIFNYIHQIGVDVLKLPPPSTALFLKSEEAAGLYEKLNDPHDDLKWELKLYNQRNNTKDAVTAPTDQISAEVANNCGALV